VLPCSYRQALTTITPRDPRVHVCLVSLSAILITPAEFRSYPATPTIYPHTTLSSHALVIPYPPRLSIWRGLHRHIDMFRHGGSFPKRTGFIGPYSFRAICTIRLLHRSSGHSMPIGIQLFS